MTFKFDLSSWRHAIARNNDPDTSLEAAASMKDAAKTLCLKIAADLKANGPGTFEEIAFRIGLDNAQVWRRLSDMEKLNLAVPTELTRRGSSGRSQRVWQAL